MPGCIIGSPADDVAALFTPTWAVGTPNANYPVANALTPEVEEVAKANENTATLQLTAGAPVTLLGLGVFHTNWAGLTVTLTNNGGMVPQTVDVPEPEDSLQINCYFDLRDVGNTTASEWYIAVAASSPVALGRVVPLEDVLEPRVRWEYQIEEVFPSIEHRNSYRKRFTDRIPVRVREFSCIADWAEDRDLLRSLRRAALGSERAWVLIPDEDDEADVFLVQFSENKHTESYTFHQGSFSGGSAEGEVVQRIEAEEVNAGIEL